MNVLWRICVKVRHASHWRLCVCVWQVIKENRLIVRGRHEERTSEMVSKNKYSKEFDLAERIDDQSVRGGVSADGRLFITAVVKGGLIHVGETSSADDHDAAVVAVDDDEILLADARGAHLIHCNVLDLASFPPSITTSASAAAMTADHH